MLNISRNLIEYLA